MTPESEELVPRLRERYASIIVSYSGEDRALDRALDAHITALEAEVAGLRAALREADRLLGDLRLGASIHNERTPGKRVEGPLWEQIPDVRQRNARALAPHQEGKGPL